MTTVAAPPGTLASDGDAHRPRPVRTPGTEDPWLTALRVERLLSHALFDTATARDEPARLTNIARGIVATLPDQLAGDFAVRVVKLGQSWRLIADLGDDGLPDAYDALWSLIVVGVRRELAARSLLYRGGAR